MTSSPLKKRRMAPSCPRPDKSALRGAGGPRRSPPSGSSSVSSTRSITTWPSTSSPWPSGPYMKTQRGDPKKDHSYDTYTTNGRNRMKFTTLNKLRAHSPCAAGWRQLLAHLGKTEADDEPLPLSVILAGNGLDDALWALRAVDDIDREARLFACDCAEAVAHLKPDSRIAACIATTSFANGDAWASARSAAWDAAESAAWDAAWSAALAARSAGRDAAWSAALAAASATKSAAESAQSELFTRYFCQP